jgi:hypothetical protein
MPVPPPPGPPAPIDSPACRDKLGEAERERERRLGGSILKGAVIGGVGGAIAGDGIGGIPGAITGGGLGGIGTYIDEATEPHPLPKECQ